MKRLIIMRGISGSGKSTWARKNHPDAVVCSADHFFLDARTGVYAFNPAKLGEAHLDCWRKTLEWIQANAPVIVVDNTNTQLWEMSPYVQMGNAFGYEVLIVRVDTPVDVAAARNTHGVPAAAVKSMADRFQKVLPFWKEVVVQGI
jgi:predicted kinase